VKELTSYRLIAAVLFIVATVWICNAFWPMMPWAPVTTIKHNYREERSEFTKCLIAALPGLVPVIAGVWLF
jgi:hypothetical protein